MLNTILKPIENKGSDFILLKTTVGVVWYGDKTAHDYTRTLSVDEAGDWFRKTEALGAVRHYFYDERELSEVLQGCWREVVRTKKPEVIVP